jgi:hypothetical protein
MAHDFKVGDQYEIKSYKTNHVAMHKGAALMIPQEEANPDLHDPKNCVA